MTCSIIMIGRIRATGHTRDGVKPMSTGAHSLSSQLPRSTQLQRILAAIDTLRVGFRDAIGLLQAYQAKLVARRLQPFFVPSVGRRAATNGVFGRSDR